MEFSLLLKGRIFLPRFGYDMALQFLIGIMSMATQRGSLLKKLEDVDHDYFDDYIIINNQILFIIQQCQYYVIFKEMITLWLYLTDGNELTVF